MKPTSNTPGSYRNELELGSFQLGRREADAIPVLQDVVSSRRQPVDADHVILRTALGELLPEEV